MKLVFDDQAAHDLESIFLWLAQDSPNAAKLVIERLYSSAEMLTTFPYMGHSGGAAGTFEWVVPRLPYVFVYEVDQARNQVVIAAVFHEARDRENG
jgi:toxin ParE1/3/4